MKVGICVCVCACVEERGGGRLWICREVQRCWCWRLCRTWRVAAERGVVDEMAVEDVRVVREDGWGGCEDAGSTALVMVVLSFGELR